MAQVKVGSTDPELLKRVAALRDNPAWGEFFERYDPLVRDWCSAYGLDPESVDELRQRSLGRDGAADAGLSVRSRRLVSRLAEAAVPSSRHRPLS